MVDGVLLVVSIGVLVASVSDGVLAVVSTGVLVVST